jgi:hypothetical protein
MTLPHILTAHEGGVPDEETRSVIYSGLILGITLDRAISPSENRSAAPSGLSQSSLSQAKPAATYRKEG